MNPNLWQILFLIGGLLLLVFFAFRGWHLGVVRQLINLGALLAAYVVAYFTGGWLIPLLRGWIQVPDFVLGVVGGVILGLLTYILLVVIGGVLFKRTQHQRVGLVRLFYGIGGAVLGLVFGGALCWVLLVGFRLTGAIAEGYLAEVEAESERTTDSVDYAELWESVDPVNPLVLQLARVKRSMDENVGGQLARSIDPIPEEVHEILAKIARMSRRPGATDRFLQFPGIREVADHPRIRELMEDDEVRTAVARGRFLQLIGHERVIEVTNDPEVRERLRGLELDQALDFALANENS